MAKTTPPAKTGTNKPAAKTGATGQENENANAGATGQENANAGVDNKDKGNSASETQAGTSAGASGQGEDVQRGSEAAPSAALLRVAARVNGFRRCGRAWPAAGVTVSADEFSAEEIETLKHDPELVVIEVAG